MASIAVGHLLAEPGRQKALGAVTVDVCEGRIAAVSPHSSPSAAEARLLAMPPLGNAHDHARLFRNATLGAGGLPFEAWTHVVASAPQVDAGLAVRDALARAALGGQGAMLLHYTRAQGLVDPFAEALQAAQAIEAVGIRVAYAVALRDLPVIGPGSNEQVLAQCSPALRHLLRERLAAATAVTLPAREQIAFTRELARQIESPLIRVQYGPYGLEWCSTELIELTAQAAAEDGRRVHMHFLETPYQRQWADRRYPQGVIRFLDEVGLLSPRLSLAHCTYLRPDEMELLAERGVTVVSNPSSNLVLKSGIARVPAMRAAGLRVALGLDGLGLDEDDDALREMRLFMHLHKGWGFCNAASGEVSPADAFDAALKSTRHAMFGLEDGAVIRPGAPADLLVLDYAAMADDLLLDGLDEAELVAARAQRAHLRRLVVAGRDVVRDGEIARFDYPALRREMLAQARVAGGRIRQAFALRADIEQGLGAFCRSSLLGCC